MKDMVVVPGREKRVQKVVKMFLVEHFVLAKT